MKTGLAATFILALTATAVQAKAPVPPAPSPPAEVIAAIAAMQDEDTPPPSAKTIRHWLKDGTLKPVHVTPNAAPDWMVDTARDFGMGWCGTGGCTVRIWAQAADGHYENIFDNQVVEYHLRPIPGKAYLGLDLDFHGAFCGLTGSDDCFWGFEFGERAGGPALISSLRYLKTPTLMPGTVPQALDPDSVLPADAPAAVIDLIHSQEVVCVKWHGTLDEDRLVTRLPDLNDDGIEEWTYAGSNTYCSFEDLEDGSPSPAQEAYSAVDSCTVLDCRSIAWLSRREADGTVTWREADWDQHKSHAYLFAPGKTPVIYEVDGPTGMIAEDTDACSIFHLDNCAKGEISLSPKP